MTEKLKPNKIKISMTIDRELYQEFKDYCEENSMKISTRVSRLIEVEIGRRGAEVFRTVSFRESQP